jgi:hypothetical protein
MPSFFASFSISVKRKKKDVLWLNTFKKMTEKSEKYYIFLLKMPI